MRKIITLLASIILMTNGFVFGQDHFSRINRDTHFTPVWSGGAYQPMTFLVSGAMMDGVDLQAGDEIGIFDGSLCVGAGVLVAPIDDSDPSDYLQVVAAKDDGDGNGFTEGNTIMYKLWRASDNTEVVVEEPNYPYAGTAHETFVSQATNVVILSQGGGQDPLEITNVVSDDPECFGSASGSITISASEGSSPYEYSINDGVSWQSSNVFTELESGLYDVKVKDNDGTETSYDQNPVILTDPSELEINDVSKTDVTEAGGSDGTVTITAAGGTGALSYTIDNGATWQSNGGAYTGLAAGTYYVGVKDNNGCETMYNDNPVLISEPQGDTHFTTVWTGGAYQPMTFLVSGAMMDGVDLQAGDEIGIFDGSLCVGAGVLIAPIDDSDPSDYLQVVAAKDDGDGNGFTEGNTIMYKLWRASDNTEVIVAEPIYPFAGYDYPMFVSQATNNVILSQGGGVDPLEITNVLSVNPECYGSASGSITISASGGSSPYQYSIDNGSSWQSSYQFEELSSGSYTVKVKDDNGSETSYDQNPVILTDPSELEINDVSTTDVTEAGGSDGTITITASGGTGALSYTIDNGATWQSNGGAYTGLAAGMYYVGVKDNNGCETMYNDNPVVISEQQGDTHFTTVWTGGAYQPMTFLVSGAMMDGVDLQAGDEIGIFDGSLCVGAGVLVAPIDDSDPSDYLQVVAAKDDGEGNGFTEGNTIMYKLWRASDNTEVIVAEPIYPFAGYDYPMFVSQATNNVILSEGGGVDPLEITNVLSVNPECYGSASGSITISASGGSSPYQYSIDNGSSWQSSNEFTALESGLYDVKVKDNDDTETSYDQNPVILTDPSELVITDVSTTDVTEAGGSDGTITITAAGGTGALSYTIDNGATWQSNAGAYTGLAAGTYYVGVKDNNGCETMYNDNPVLISEPQGDTHFTTVWTGGAYQPMTFFINAANIDDVPLEPGDEIGIFDGDACVGAATMESSLNPDDLSDYMQMVAAKDDGDGNGFTEGNTILYRFWDSSEETEVMVQSTEFPVPAYEFEDFASMETVLVSLFSNTVAQPVIASVTTTDLNCYEINEGSITIEAENGVEPYEYSIDNGATWQVENVFNDLAAGNYYVKVKDANGSEVEYENNPVVITQPTMMQINDVIVTDVEGCHGDETGGIQIVGAGGTPPYEYSIDGGDNWHAEAVFSNLPAGIYNVSMRDANGCMFVYLDNPVMINEPALLGISDVFVTNVVGCYGDETGEIEVVGMGGTQAYEYSIDGGDNWQFENAFTGLAAGEYYVSVRDANGCLVEYDNNPVTIMEPELLVIEDVLFTNVEGCNGDESGEIEIFGMGGTPDYEYSIDGGENWQLESMFMSLAAGEYYIALRDANGCLVEYENNPVTIIEPELLIIEDVLVTNVEGCHGDATGAIEILEMGGTPDYEYSIDGGDSWHPSGLFSDLTAGEYHIALRDANGCLVEYDDNPVTITEPVEISITNVVTTDPQCYACSNGSIEISAEGGFGDLMYSVDNGISWQGAGLFELLSAGEYHILVKDEYECISEYENNPVILTQPGEDTYYTPVWEGNPYNAMTVYITGVTIEGVPSSDMLEIGIFDVDANGDMICVGVGKASDISAFNYLTVLASENDALAGDAENGFTSGNNILYKIWDGTDEYTNITSEYFEGMPSVFTSLETTSVNLEVMQERTLDIDLSSGWNIVSFNVSPEDMNLLSIVQPLIDNGTLIKVQDEQGNSIQYLPWIGVWNNSIGDMQLSEGYQMKLSAEDQLSATGLPASMPYDIPMSVGWNIMGYPAEYPQDALDAFNPLIENGTLIKVQNEQGQSIQYLPWIGIWNNSIGNLYAGEGYQVKMSAEDLLTLNEGEPAEMKASDATLEITDYFNFEYEGNPYQAMSLIIKEVAIEGLSVEPGDEIAAFDLDANGEWVCVGATTVQTEIDDYNPLIFPVSMDDPGTEEQDGFISGNSIVLKIYDASENEVIETFDLYFTEGYASVYEELGTAIIEVSGQYTSIVSLNEILDIRLMPNPTTNDVTLSMNLIENSAIDVMIIDAVGKPVRVVHKKHLQGRFYETLATSDLPAGLYSIKIVLNDKVYFKKLIKQ